MESSVWLVLFRNKPYERKGEASIETQSDGNFLAGPIGFDLSLVGRNWNIF